MTYTFEEDSYEEPTILEVKWKVPWKYREEVNYQG